MKVVGLDIGGANLKAADSDGQVNVIPFAIWKHPEQLEQQLLKLLEVFSSYQLLTVTMTAELADCFESKNAGVRYILQMVEKVSRQKPVFVWQTGAEFVTPEVALKIPYLVSAANWHALATWVGRLVPDGPALLIDIGSTTTDIIPMLNGVPVPNGFTDRERLQRGELVYTGVRRTPVCAVSNAVPLGAATCRIAAEIFATMQDVYLLLGCLPENELSCETADGRPETILHAHNRIAHMCCCDTEELSFTEAREIAQFLKEEQIQLLNRAIDEVLSRLSGECQSWLISGNGSFLAHELISRLPVYQQQPIVDVDSLFSQNLSNSACAYALAMLGLERL